MKRIISLITALVMCISLLPAVNVFAVVGDDVTYYLSAGEENTIAKDTDLWNVTDFSKSTFHYFGADEEIEQVIGGEELTGWTGTVGDATSRLLRVRDKFLRFKTNQPNVVFSDGRWFALKLDTSELTETVYNLQFAIAKGTKNYTIWLAPYVSGQDNAAAYMTDGNKLATKTFAADTVTFENVAVDPAKDEYVLVIRQEAIDELNLTSFTFVSLSEDEPETPEQDYTSYTIDKTKVVKYNLTLGAFDKELLDSSVYDGSKISRDAFEGNIGWNAENSAGKKTMVFSDDNAPWSIDYTKLEAHRSSSRVTDTFTRIDFQNGNTSGTGETFYNNGFTGNAETTRPYLALRIFVPNAGRFNVAIQGTTGKKGVTDVYLAKSAKSFYGPGDVEDLITDKNYLGVYDCSANSYLAKELVTLEKGEYVFLFVPNEKSKEEENDNARLLLSEISLTPVFGFGSAKLALSENDIKTGAYAYPSVEVFDEQGVPCAFDHAEITYSVDKDGESVAYVNPETGEIYAKRPGKAKITVTVKDDIATVSDTVELNVTSRFAQTSLPAEIKASFPLGGIELGTPSPLKITDGNGNELGDGIEYTYEIAKSERYVDGKLVKYTAVEEDDGIFTGLELGKADITVTAELNGESVSTTLTASIVGENLFTLGGVRHGEFEGNVYISGNPDAAASKAETIWSAAQNTDDDIYKYTYFKNIASDITNRRTSVIKATVDNTPSETGKNNRVFRVENGTTPANATELENGKVYEYTGFVKLDNVETFPKIQIRRQIYKVNGGAEIEKDEVDIYPFDGLSGNMPWTQFKSGPFYANWEEPVVARSKVQASADNVVGYDVSIAHLAFREVSFESVDFTMQGSFVNAKTYDTFATDAVAISGTGEKIVVGNTGTAIKVNYSSSDPVVAKVDDSGVITAVSDGDCEIYADITLGNVTRRGVIPVHLEGLEVKFESIELSADTELKAGDTTEIEIDYYNTDRSKRTDEGLTLYYESKNSNVASVSQNGVITANNPGTAEIFVYASLGAYTAKSSVIVTVTDGTPLASAYIEGAEKVDIGFTSKLTPGAKHESGANADMTQWNYSFALKNPEDNAILTITPDGTVEGLAEGEAVVVLTVAPDGANVTCEHTVKVVQGQAKRKIFDFLIHTSNTSILNATVEKFGWQVNREKTSPTRIAEGESGVFGKLRFLAYAIQFRSQGAYNIEGDLALDLLADYAGWYNITFVGARKALGTNAIIYMNDEYLGECSFKAPDDDSNSNFTAKLNPVYLKKGLNTFTLRAGSESYLYPVRITLDYIGEEAPVPQSATLDVGATTVPLGTVLSPSVTAKMSQGHDYVFGLDFDFVVNDAKKYTLTSDKPSVVKVTDDGGLEAVGEGTARITANVTYGDYTFAPYVDITVTPKGFTTVLLSADKTVMAPNGEGSQSTVKALDNLGDEMVIPVGTEILYHSSDTGVVTVDENGYITPHGQGSATLSATLTLDGITLSGSLNVSVRHGKIKSTYYTDNKIEAALENITKYSWAKEEKKAAVALADKYLPNLEVIYNYIHSPDIPRGYLVGFFDDPDMFYCRYCGEYIYSYSKYPWVADALNRPWKIQCPDCKRLFPSNDFESLYELVTENNHGIYDVELAHELNEKVKAESGGKVDYLKNVLYPEIGDQVTVANGGKPGVNVTINAGKGLRPGETVEGWGVDDGLGYMPKKPDGTRYFYDNGVPEVHSYISTFAHAALWKELTGTGSKAVVHTALQSFRDAYLYTGDEKYGRAGIILLDRIADYYPAFDLSECGKDEELGIVTYQNTGGSGMGKIIGNIWEATEFAEVFAMSYDAFFDLYDDPQVVSYLNDKAKKLDLYELANSEDKKFDKYDRLADKFVENENGEPVITPETLRQNVESGILKEILPAVKKMQIAGNFGFKQNTMAKAAVILDTQPYTQEIIDFIMAPGETDDGVCTGGNVMAQIINIVDRDGVGNESSLGYCRIWPENLLGMAQTLGEYEDVELEDDLLANPKYIKMLQLDTITALPSKRQANLGDGGGALSAGFAFTKDLFIAALDAVGKWNASEEFKQEKRILLSQAIYLGNGNTTDELHYDIFTKNPESIKKSIEDVVKEYGEYDLSQSSIHTGFGFAALRDGINFTGETLPSNIDNTTRDFFIYFGGGNTSHHHYDGLNLGMDAFGIDMASDLGYPAVTGGKSNHVRTEWIAGTVSHNTVVVNDDRQRRTDYAGNPLHFDDSGEIKVMDIDMPDVYGKYVDTYRRTLVSVDVDDTVSYGIDFFRIIGGDEHVYSFHSRAFEAELDDKIKTVHQPIGTYAGADVPYGDVAYSEKSDSGYNWLDNVDRAANPGTGSFWMDFDVEKVTKVQVTEQDWHLRMTMLNDFNLSEIALADGYGPQYGTNPETPFRYVLARRSGKNLNTLFTTVLEPYVGQSNIKSLERVPVAKNGNPVKESDGVAAVRVTLNNGRVDYVVYATDSTEIYRIDDLFDFSGFIGVYTVTENDADNYVRSYLLDGTKVGNTEATAAVSGKVTGFTKELAFENFVELQLDSELPENVNLVGRLLNVANDGQQNGAYIITSADVSGNTLKLGVGDVTFIRSFVDSFDTSKGYYYNIEEGQLARISLSAHTTSAPSIERITDKTVSAGSSITIPIAATSDHGRDITYVGTTLPRGMSINQKTGIITWKPDASQVGNNHVAI
ncbi:MAG: heparinase II/III family protein, partial [Oscillospiraceae bacterium]|nr:heparinase II/III family protein [Oscillospiraceae bacterium]